MNFPKKGLRTGALICSVLVVFVVYTLELMQMQVGEEGKRYKEMLDAGSTQEQIIEAARGEILDRYGNPLAINTTGYNVVLDRAYLPREEQNRIILDLTKLLSAEGEEWIDKLPITKTQPLQFLQDAPTVEESDRVYAAQVERLKRDVGVAPYTSVDDVMYNLVKRYKLEDFSPADQRTIAGVRYEMERRGFSVSVRYTFAENVSISTVTKVKERGFDLKGADIAESSIRQYVSGSIMPHIIGYIGPMYKEEYDVIKKEKNDKLKEINKDYKLNDTIGKAGAELQFEDTLRGRYGVRRITLNASGDVVKSETVEEPVPGNTVVLTIDSKMQQVAQSALANEIDLLQRTAPAGKGREADSGAAVVIDVKTGEVLAAATYPSYDMQTFKYDYDSLTSDERKPLINRAYFGTYAVGSCFKPITAIAGLARGIITPTSAITCNRVYMGLPGSENPGAYRPTCLSTHGSITVLDALRYSCNIFFYDTGYKLTIGTIDEYATQFGLAQPTGLELPEMIGELSSPETKAKYESDPWFPGDTVQSAIGQLYNNFTVLQMANYTATLANRGTRMEAHIVKSIEDYNFDKTVFETKPVVAGYVDAPREAFDTVAEGMLRATRIGTSQNYIGDYPIDIASKTGTPETHRYPNSVFIAFAPVRDPQIAVAVVIEDGWHGYTGAPVARAIFDQYFYSQDQSDVPEEYGTLLP